MKHFTADFETATWLKDETFVWAWATCDIDTEEIIIGNDIETFIEKCKKEKNSTFLFHNLKFDGEFIIFWALTNGFKHVVRKEDIENNTFTTLISDLGQFYSITLYFKKDKNKHVHKVTFLDSLKVINMGVKEIAKTYGLTDENIDKLEIDYNKPRERGHILTKEEEDYIKNDVLIVAKALKVLYKNDLTKMTAASNALTDYREIITRGRFQHFFPTLDKNIDADIRQAYKGRFYLFESNIQRKNS